MCGSGDNLWELFLCFHRVSPGSPTFIHRVRAPVSDVGFQTLTRFGILAFLFNWNICGFVCVSFLPPFNDIYSLGCDVTVPLSRLLRLNA